MGISCLLLILLDSKKNNSYQLILFCVSGFVLIFCQVKMYYPYFTKGKWMHPSSLPTLIMEGPNISGSPSRSCSFPTDTPIHCLWLRGVLRA